MTQKPATTVAEVALLHNRASRAGCQCASCAWQLHSCVGSHPLRTSSTRHKDAAPPQPTTPGRHPGHAARRRQPQGGASRPAHRRPGKASRAAKAPLAAAPRHRQPAPPRCSQPDQASHRRLSRHGAAGTPVAPAPTLCRSQADEGVRSSSPGVSRRRRRPSLRTDPAPRPPDPAMEAPDPASPEPPAPPPRVRQRAPRHHLQPRRQGPRPQREDASPGHQSTGLTPEPAAAPPTLPHHRAEVSSPRAGISPDERSPAAAILASTRASGALLRRRRGGEEARDGWRRRRGGGAARVAPCEGDDAGAW
ncbi:hypothetical protein PVAP13_8KG031102 [Panicum virgatum]|uniref:Uncharacterized protein n=1 Tax=Panicum virgatum TaxID=38727 RepID=A0A8T0PGK9_PANVG|nr:hypothetical protein PVAP13_8KG031102 [Panicum virgatum]